MAEWEPGLYLRARRDELGRKPGGGGAKATLVPVTPSLRASLSGSVAAASARLEQLSPAQQSLGIPVRIKLREKALAKSNRPARILSDAGALPSATLGLGELVTQAGSRELRALQQLLFDERGALTYDVSTIESISVWEPIRDGFGLRVANDLPEILRGIAEQGRSLRIEFFPWLRLATRIDGSRTVGEVLASLGLELISESGTSGRPTAYFDIVGEASLEEIDRLYGIRGVSATPSYGALEEIGPQGGLNRVPLKQELGDHLATGPESASVVGVLDSGVDPTHLGPWLLAHEVFDPPQYRDPWHGTFVAGLIAAAGALNGDQERFPRDGSSILDAQILGVGLTDEATLTTRIEDVLAKHASTIKVWNCSFSATQENSPVAYSPLASQFDSWSEKYGVLFVQAAGNYEDQPMRTWPPTPGATLTDGIATPAEAVHSLTVGSLSHKGGASPEGAPASYSRRGPSFGGQQKPDLCFFSGDAVAGGGGILDTGIWSLDGTDSHIAESIGTSFATPIVSTVAAQVWEELQLANDLPDVTPELVKGLLVHSAAVRSKHDPKHQHYLGAGMPAPGVNLLFDDAGSFTTVHEVDLSNTWMRTPFPIPACLLIDGTKLKADVTMTVAYAPPIDDAFGDECVRTSVEASFGVVSVGDDGKHRITGKLPVDKPKGGYTWEKQRIAEGKWSPIKTYRKRFPQGVAGSTWGLRLALTEREPTDVAPVQRVFVILTFKGLSDGLPVRTDGRAAVSRLRLWNAPLSSQTSLDLSV